MADRLALWGNVVDSPTNSSSEPVYGSLHDVVGRDGVLMISVENQSSGRLSHALGKLAAAGIQPTMFSATEATGNRTGNLSEACMHADEPEVASYCGEASGTGRKGDGCRTKIEQAITDSHRRALMKAQEREQNWTVIIEDDAVPVVPERFSETFKNAWKNVPDTIKFIRLGWCTFEIDRGPIEYRDYIKADDAKLVSFMHWTRERLNLLTLAPGGQFGRFVIWTEGAFKKLSEMYGTLKGNAPMKSGYRLPRAMMENADVARIINSDEVQSVLRPKLDAPKKHAMKKNALTNKAVMAKLNPGSAQKSLMRKRACEKGTEEQKTVEKTKKARVTASKAYNKKEKRGDETYYKKLMKAFETKAEEKDADAEEEE